MALIVVAGGLLEGLHGRVKKLVDHSPSQRLDGRNLFLAERAKTRLDAAQLGLPHLFNLMLQSGPWFGQRPLQWFRPWRSFAPAL